MAINSADIQAMVLKGPAMAPPNGQKTNFVDPPNIYAYYILTTTMCVTISTLALAMRMYTKISIMRRFGREDCKMCPALVLECLSYAEQTLRS